MSEPTLNPAQSRSRWCFAMLTMLALMGVSMGMDCNGNMNGEEPIFPANYRDTYQLVRDCRNSIEHANQIRVWINDVGAAGYLADEDPLPVGTIVVKEEFAAGNCDDDNDLVFWSVMRKEQPGFDADNNDWDFREYSAPDRAQLPTPKQTCIACHNDPDCVARDYMCTAP